MKNHFINKPNLYNSILLIVSLTLTILSACGPKPTISNENNLPLSTITALNTNTIFTSTNTKFTSTNTIFTPMAEINIDPNIWRNIGPWTDAQSILIDPRSPNTLYVWTPFQMIKSTDAGENWEAMQSLQNINYFFYIDNMIIDPMTLSTLYAIKGLITDAGELTGTGELFKSTDGGINWEDLGIEIEIGAIAINTGIPNILYVGTKSMGISKSNDGGRTWVDVNNGLAKANGDNYVEILDLAIDSKTPSIIYAGTNNGEIYRSTNDGANWEVINTGFSNTSIKVIVTDPSKSTILYAVTEGEGIIKSTNNGGTWSTINNGLTETNIISLAIDPSTSTTIYAGTLDSGIFKSTDGGDHWSEVFIPTTSVELFCFQGIKDIVIDAMNPATVLAMTGGELGKFMIKSTDSGNNWNIIIPDMYASLVESIEISPEDPTTIYAGTRAGVLKSLNGGGKWSSTDLSDDITTIMFDPANPSILYGISASDIYKSTNQGGNWNKITPTEYSYSITSITKSPTNKMIIYAMDIDSLIISKSTDGGETWSHNKYKKSYNTPFGILMIDPLTPTTLYAESPYDGVFKSMDSGENWQLINPALTGLQTLDIDPKTPTNLYAGTENDGVFRSTDGGGSWEPINKGLDNLSVRALVIEPETPTTLYMATLEGVYKSMDKGDTWEPFNTHVPNLNTTISTLFIDPLTPNTLYAGTFLQGIYVIRQEK
jgi:photosystem II stability/assembly factor-like uncharacterized protein